MADRRLPSDQIPRHQPLIVQFLTSNPKSIKQTESVVIPHLSDFAGGFPSNIWDLLRPCAVSGSENKTAGVGSDMTRATQERGSAPDPATSLQDADRYDPLRIALRNARDAFDPDRAMQERRAPAAPLIWYIEDTPDMALSRTKADPDARPL